MQHNRLRFIPVLIAVDPGTVADIQIFQIGKMFFIKITDLFKYGSSVDCGTATGGKHRDRLIIIRRRSSLPPGIGPAQHAVTVSGIIDELRSVPHQHLRTDGKYLFIFADSII